MRLRLAKYVVLYGACSLGLLVRPSIVDTAKNDANSKNRCAVSRPFIHSGLDVASHRHFLEHGAETVGGVAERGHGVSLQPGGVCHRHHEGKDQDDDPFGTHLKEKEKRVRG